MNRKFALAALAALTVAGSAVPALAFERHRGFSSGPGVSVGLGFGDYRPRGDWDRGHYAPGAAVSVGFGGPGWGYDDWGSASYVAASDYYLPLRDALPDHQIGATVSLFKLRLGRLPLRGCLLFQ
jgi:hypothetical protein